MCVLALGDTWPCTFQLKSLDKRLGRGCAQVMVKKKRTKKVSVPVVAHTLSLTEDDVSVRLRSQIL